jgi:hypothetical protein
MLPALAGVGILTLAACGATGDGTGTDPTATTTPDATGSPSPTQDDDATAGGADCVEGEWDGDLEAAERRVVDSLDLGALEVEPEVSVSGESIVEFDGSMMTTEFQDQVTEVLLAVDGEQGDQEVMVTVRLDGTLEGTYTVSGDTLSVTDVDVSGLESEVTAELAGEEYDLPGVEALGSDSYAVDQEFTFECDDEELRLTPVADVDLEDGGTASPDPTESPDATTSPDPTESPDATTAPDDDETELDALTQVLTRR